MLKNRVYACLLAVLLLAGALSASTAAAGVLPAGTPAYEESLLTGVSPLGTTINLFDYCQTAPTRTVSKRKGSTPGTPCFSVREWVAAAAIMATGTDGRDLKALVRASWLPGWAAMVIPC